MQSRWDPDPRRRRCEDQSGILWDTDKWNCQGCFCTDHFHTAVCASGTRQYLRTNTDFRCLYWDFPRGGHSRYRQSPTDAAFAREVYLKAFVAGAFECPQHILTHSILADVGVQGTLINIWEDRELTMKPLDVFWEKPDKPVWFLPLPSPVVPIPLGHSARNSAATKKHK